MAKEIKPIPKVIFKLSRLYSQKGLNEIKCPSISLIKKFWLLKHIDQIFTQHKEDFRKWIDE